MIETGLCFIVGLVLGGGIGFLIAGVSLLEQNQKENAEQVELIKYQQDLLNRYSKVTKEMYEMINGSENDLK